MGSAPLTSYVGLNVFTDTRLGCFDLLVAARMCLAHTSRTGGTCHCVVGFIRPFPRVPLLGWGGGVVVVWVGLGWWSGVCSVGGSGTPFFDSPLLPNLSLFPGPPGLI